MSPVDLFTFCRVKILTYSLRRTLKKKQKKKQKNSHGIEIKVLKENGIVQIF